MLVATVGSISLILARRQGSKTIGKGLKTGNRTPAEAIAGEVDQTASRARATSTANSQRPEKRLDDLKDLDISPNPKRTREQRDRPVSINNTRKREAEGDPESPDPPVEGNIVGSMSGRSHHGKTRSGGRHADFIRHGDSPSDSDYRRGPAHTKQPLFDPNLSATNATKALRRDKQHSHPNAPGRSKTLQDSTQISQISSLKGKDGVKLELDQDYGASCLEPPFCDVIGQHSFQQLSPPRDREDHSSVSPPGEERPEVLEVEPELLLQPETRPISHEQLVVEVKGIYAGLVMVEAKCIDIDERQSAAAQEKEPAKRFELKNDQWQSLIAIHKQVGLDPSKLLTKALRMINLTSCIFKLLHEHHDFFLASQHPSASAALSRLAAKYSMPARMWRHGIHSFLEVLRHRLPDSLEHMLAFIYIAYSMMALLYETVPAFEDTWIECLGRSSRIPS